MEQTENSSDAIPEEFPAPSATGEHRTANVALWSLQIFLAAVFLIIGAGELFGFFAPAVELFERIAPNSSLRYIAGAIEIVGAFLLLIPHYSGRGALLLIVAMTTAIFTHIFYIGGSPAAALILLILLCVVAVGRRGTIAKVLWT